MLSEQRVAEPQAWPMLQRRRCQHDDLKHLLLDWVRLIWFSFRGIDIRPEPKCAYLTPLQLLHGTLDTAKSLFPRGRICTDLESDYEFCQWRRGCIRILCKTHPSVQETQGTQCSGLGSPAVYC